MSAHSLIGSVKKRARVLIPSVAAVLAISGCQHSTTVQDPVPSAMPVQVQVVKSEKIPLTTDYLTILKSRHSAVINPEVEGQITKIFVKSGNQVKAGAPLLQIYPVKQEATVQSQEAARAAQEANVALAKTNLQRAQKLFDAGVISKMDFDNAQTAYDTATAQLHSLHAQVQQQQVELKYYQVTAPFGGIVGDIPVHVGDRVQVSTQLTTVDEPGGLEAYLYIPTSRARELKPGLPVKLLNDAGVVLDIAHISFVSPQVDPGTQTILAKAAVDNPKTALRASQQVTASVQWGEENRPVVPVLSVTRINGQFFAFVAVNEGKSTVAKERLLRIGDAVGNDYVVLEGLKAGEHLITSGLQFLQEGMPVMEQMTGEGKSSETPAAGSSSPAGGK